jgi:hypothetical protein
MLSVSYEEYYDVIDAVKYQPCVSIIMPFEPKMGQKSAIESRLKSAMNKVKNELQDNYPDEKAVPVFHKLFSLIKNLNYSTHKKSIAVFVSPIIEKVYYLNVPVKEKIIIDESFGIRDLIHSKKEIYKYLVLMLSNERNSIFLGDPSQFTRIVSNTPESIANFTDVSYGKEQLLDKFLQHTDNGLGNILQSYSFPLFVVGTENLVEHFKKLTHNNDRVLYYIHGNYEVAEETEIRKAIIPYLTDWKKVKQQYLLLQLSTYLKTKKLAIGIEEVWTKASLKKGRLLVVEKNYMYPAQCDAEEDIYNSADAENNSYCIKDAVDDVIKKVLESGGDVEFVDKNILKDYQRIALIQY